MPYDQNIFQGVAHYYAQYRRGYPEAFYEHLERVFCLTKNYRVLDLGTGIGQIAFALAPRVGEVVATDINSEMIAEGGRIAEEKKVKNIVWAVSSAEEVSYDLGMFDLVTIGSAFHWMEGNAVLDRAYAMMNRNGGIAIVANTNSIHRNNERSVWKKIAREVIEKHVGQERKAGKARLYREPKERFEDIVDASQFVRRESFVMEYEEQWSIDEIIGYLHSTSFASSEVLGERWNAFESEMRKRLEEMGDAGVFFEKQKLDAILAYKE